MKLKFYLRGLGIGIIVTALILTVSNNARADRQTGDNVIKPSDSVINITQPHSKENNTVDDSAKELTNASTEQVTVKETASPTEPESKSPTQAATEPTVAPSASKDVIKVTLNNITYSGKAAQILADAGVIDDKDAFNKYLMEKGYSTKILDGSYEFTNNQDYESVAKTITRR